MRVALIHNPPQDDSILPMSTLTLAAVGREHGVESELFVLPARDAEDDLLDQLAGSSVVGFSTVCSDYPRVLLMAARLKRISPKTKIVFGGPQATSTAHRTVEKFPAVDLVIRGEAEISWASLLAEAKAQRWNWNNVEGAVWNDGNQVRDTSLPPLLHDLDRIPVPAYDAYRPAAARQAASVEVGRGCPYGCTFCSTNTFFARRFRLKSPGRILREVDLLKQLYDVSEFHFIHDMFTVRRDLVEDVCSAMRQRPFSWSCSARTDRLSPALMQQMKDSGCFGLYCGIETGSQDLQRSIRKNLIVEDAVKTMRQARATGLNLAASLIIGYPQEKRQDLRASLLLSMELMAGLANIFQLPIFVPLADTPLAREGWKFEFDGVASNTVETSGRLSNEENELIRGDFELFSAFYHPSETEYSRRDYLALATLMETLGSYPSLKDYLLNRARNDFVDFLLTGDFAVDPYRQLPHELCVGMFLQFARNPRHGRSIHALLEFEQVRQRLSTAPSGLQMNLSVPRACASSLLATLGLEAPPGSTDSVTVGLRATGRGLVAGVATDPASLPAAPYLEPAANWRLGAALWT